MFVLEGVPGSAGNVEVSMPWTSYVDSVGNLAYFAVTLSDLSFLNLIAFVSFFFGDKCSKFLFNV